MNTNTLTPLPGSTGCFICDKAGVNPRSLQLKLFWHEEEQKVVVPFTPDATWCGYDNVVHGGLAAAVLDEAMAWAVKTTIGEWAFTAECNLRYKTVVNPGQEYIASAKVTENKGRIIKVEAALTDAKGTVAVLAQATFLPVKGKAAPRS